MSLHAMRWAFRLPVKGPRKSVLVALADHCRDGLVCWPSAARLALWAGCSERAARDAVHELSRLGHIEITVREGQTCMFRLLVPDQLPPPPVEDDEEYPGTSRPDPGTSRIEPRNLTPQPRHEVPTNLLEAPKEEPLEPKTRAREEIPAASKRKQTPGDSGQLALIPGDKPRSSGLINGKLDAFRQFWDLYPHRLEHGKMVKPGKWAAEQAFAAAIRRVEPQAIIAAVQNFPFPENPKYIQAPENWLRGGNFEADFQPVDPDDADPFAALKRMQAEAPADEFGGPTIDAELEEYPHG